MIFATAFVWYAGDGSETDLDASSVVNNNSLRRSVHRARARARVIACVSRSGGGAAASAAGSPESR